jgi:DNA modification methylase
VKPYYQDESVTLYHGDCRDVVPTLPRVDLVATDPPYAMGARNGEWSVTASVAIGINEAAKRVRAKGSMLVFTTTSGRGIEFTQGAVGRKLPFNRLLIWQKPGGRSRAASPWAWDSVAILLFGRAPSGVIGESAVFQHADEPDPEHDADYIGHPSMLPSPVCDWLLRPFTPEHYTGLTCLDPFAGSGALLHAAQLRGYRVIGVEQEERYCEIAARRLSQGALTEMFQ